MPKIKLAIVGSRDYKSYNNFVEHLEEFVDPDDISLVVSGGAKGTDSLARKWAKENYIPLTEHLPDWNTFGRSAGFRRNGKIVADADYVIAFLVNESAGTSHTIKIAKEQGRALTVLSFSHKPMKSDRTKYKMTYEGVEHFNLKKG